MRVTYPIPFEHAEERLRLSSWVLRRNQAYNSWYTLNLLSQLEPVTLLSRIRRKSLAGTVTASYDDYERDDLLRLEYAYDQIIRLADQRPVTIYVIPRERDFIARAAGSFQGRILHDLAVFSQSRRVRVVDLMPGFVAHMQRHGVPYESFFLGYDPHWSPEGHQVAARIVMETQRALSQDAGNAQTGAVK